MIDLKIHKKKQQEDEEANIKQAADAEHKINATATYIKNKKIKKDVKNAAAATALQQQKLDEEERIATAAATALQQKLDEEERIATAAATALQKKLDDEERIAIATANAATATATELQQKEKQKEEEKEKKDNTDIIIAMKLLSPPKIALLEIGPYKTDKDCFDFWLPYFNNNKQSIKRIQSIIYLMSTGDKEFSCQIPKIIRSYSIEDSTPSASAYGSPQPVTDIINKNILPPHYEDILCANMYFVGMITAILNNDYDVILKGGKSIQAAMTCDNKYTSKDVDLYIRKKNISRQDTLHHNDNIDGVLEKELSDLSEEIGKFYIWIMTLNSDIKHAVSSAKIIQKEPIVKISILHNKIYTPVIDISYKPNYNEIYTYKNSDMKITQIPDPIINNMYFGYLLSPNMNTLIRERLYYLIKFFTGLYNTDDNLDYFTHKIYRSINALLSCDISILKPGLQIIYMKNDFYKQTPYITGLNNNNNEMHSMSASDFYKLKGNETIYLKNELDQLFGVHNEHFIKMIDDFTKDTDVSRPMIETVNMEIEALQNNSIISDVVIPNIITKQSFRKNKDELKLKLEKNVEELLGAKMKLMETLHLFRPVSLQQTVSDELRNSFIQRIKDAIITPFSSTS